MIDKILRIAVKAAEDLIEATWPDLHLGETTKDDVIVAHWGEGSPTIECHWQPGDERDPAECWGPVDSNCSSWVVGDAVKAMRLAISLEAEHLDIRADEPEEGEAPEHLREDAADLRRMAASTAPDPRRLTASCIVCSDPADFLTEFCPVHDALLNPESKARLTAARDRRRHRSARPLRDALNRELRRLGIRMEVKPFTVAGQHPGALGYTTLPSGQYVRLGLFACQPGWACKAFGIRHSVADSLEEAIRLATERAVFP